LWLLSVGTAHAQVGWEVEWNNVDVMLIDHTVGQNATSIEIGAKERFAVVGADGTRWNVETDDAHLNPTPCPAEVRRRWPTIQSAAGGGHAVRPGRCWQAYVEFNTVVPRRTNVEIRAHMQALQAAIAGYQANGLLAQDHANGGGGIAIIPAAGNANRDWVISMPQDFVRFSSRQVNMDIPLTYFQPNAAPGANRFLNAQFADFWGSNLQAPVALRVGGATEGFYKIFEYYARRLDLRGAPFNKNTLNPNMKFNMCAARNAANAWHANFVTAFSAGGQYQVQQAAARRVLVQAAAANDECRFTTDDVTEIPVAGNHPVWEFRVPDDRYACFHVLEIVRGWLNAGGAEPGGGQGLQTKSTDCAADVP
jgi:hypothetical protein